MAREKWTPWIGIQDIFAYLRKRAHWGALCWLLFLWFAYMSQHYVGLTDITPWRSLLIVSVGGGYASAKLMTWNMSRDLQWAGGVQYLVTTIAIAAFIGAITFLVHQIHPFEVRGAYEKVLLWSTAGVFVRAIPYEGSWRY